MENGESKILIHFYWFFFLIWILWQLNNRFLGGLHSIRINCYKFLSTKIHFNGCRSDCIVSKNRMAVFCCFLSDFDLMLIDFAICLLFSWIDMFSCYRWLWPIGKPFTKRLRWCLHKYRAIEWARIANKWEIEKELLTITPIRGS